MYNKNDPHILWVNPNDSSGQGTFELPYGSINEALKSVQPGNTIVLKQGIYKDDLTFEICGKPEQPIRIVSDTDAEVIIDGACWFFYDTSDIIISNLVFKDAPYGAISVIGSCKRNRFDSLQFVNCGTTKKASCTMYFGGSGGEFNLVENCLFQQSDLLPVSKQDSQNARVALMISEGDIDGLAPIRNHILRHNRFVNYGYAILIGTQDSTTNPYGHLVQYNTISNCANDGIVVKCGDTQIKGNLLENCSDCSISVQAGIGTVIEDNRIVNSNTGINIHGFGHSISNNCIIRCKEAVAVCGKSDKDKSAASNLLIDRNTLIYCGIPDDSQSAFIRIEQGTTSVIQQNIFHGDGTPYRIISTVCDHDSCDCQIPKGKTHSVVNDNIGSGNCSIMDGIIRNPITFLQEESDCFINDSGYGADGWMLRPEGFDRKIDEPEDNKDYIEASIMEDDDGNLIIPGENFDSDIFSRYYQEVSDQSILTTEEFEE